MQLVKDLPLIMMNEIGYEYPNGTEALKNINLKIFRGELIGIMGKNGAGKTSLIRTLNGLIRPTHGSIYIENENIKTKSIATLSKKVGIIFQNPFHQLFANSVEEEIDFSLKSLNLSNEEVQLKIDQILLEFDLEKYRMRSPLNLSGGESKKLAVASIICRNPEILIFDEPTLGQDAREIEFFINLINQEIKKGKTIIIITHNIEFAFEHLPRIILMADGHIVADGPTVQILNNEFLINQASLVLPQIRQLYLALQQLNLELETEINSKNEMTDYLRKLIKHKSSNI
jgi:energy-coupling factor transporter ATP-binding protein EcfA2